MDIGLVPRGSRYILFLTEDAHAKGLCNCQDDPTSYGCGLAELPFRALLGGLSEEFPQIPEEEFISQIETLAANG